MPNFRPLLVAGTLLAALTGSSAAQRPLDRFSYDNLGFHGFWPEIGILTSDRLEGTVSYGARIDLGQFAPRLRMLFGVSYFRSDFKSGEIAEFETALEDVVTDPTQDFSIALGDIRWADLAVEMDLQYMLTPMTSRYLPYLGLGVGMHVRNGSGDAINDTFVEDALDMLGAGISATAGLDVRMGSAFVLNLGGRAVFGSDLQTVGLTVGFGYRR
jgi:hypothetical protein